MKVLKMRVALFLLFAVIGSPLSLYADPVVPSNDIETQPTGFTPQQTIEAQAAAENLVKEMDEKKSLQSSAPLTLQQTQVQEELRAYSPDGTLVVNAFGNNKIRLRNRQTGALIREISIENGVGIGDIRFTSDSANFAAITFTTGGVRQLSVYTSQGSEVGKITGKLWKLGDHIAWTSTNLVATTDGNVYAFSPGVFGKVLTISPGKDVILMKKYNSSTNQVTEEIAEFAKTAGRWGAPKVTAVNTYTFNPDRFDRTYVAKIINGDQVVFVTTGGDGASKIRIFDCGRILFDSSTIVKNGMRVLKIVYSKGVLTVTYQPFLGGGNFGEPVTKSLYRG